MSDERILVRVGDMRVARAGSVLVTLGVGSCIAVALYDPVHSIAGLAHALLPEPHAGGSGPPGRFVSTATERLLAMLREAGAGPDGVVAWIAGGASMFPGLAGAGVLVGERNTAAARAALAAANVPLRGEAVGGSHGRSIFLPVEEGVLRVTSVFDEDVILRA